LGSASSVFRSSTTLLDARVHQNQMSMSARTTGVAIAVVSCAVLGGRMRRASAYPQYSQAGDATYCRACHGDFRATSYYSLADDADWGVNLHLLHRDTMLGGDCDTCHSSGSRFPVLIDSSKGGTGLDPISCMGCHGRDEDNTAANPEYGGLGGRGAGLRQHHVNAGIMVCAGCHEDALPANYTPVGEEVAPAYYANPGTGHPAIPSDPCNADGSEDLAGLATGVDNDGDGFYDGADTDCGAIPDAGLSDAGAAAADAMTADASAGVPDAMTADASAGVLDAMTADASAGVPDAAVSDAGPLAPDGASASPDAGAAGPDARASGPDAGIGSNGGGCSCRTGGHSQPPPLSTAWVLLAAFLVLRRRRAARARNEAGRRTSRESNR